jgi:hypothetical protein
LAKEINVYRISYEIGSVSWNVSIAAFDNGEAQEFLRRHVNNPRITATNHLGKIDTFAPNVIRMIVEANVPKKKPVGRPKKKDAAKKK